MRKIRTALLLLLAVCATFLAAGCAGKDEESEYKFYYLNLEENALAEEAWEPESEDTGAMADEMASALFEAPEDTEHMNLFPEEVKLQEYNLEDGTITLDFSSAYLSMDATREILVRAALVRS